MSMCNDCLQENPDRNDNNYICADCIHKRVLELKQNKTKIQPLLASQLLPDRKSEMNKAKSDKLNTGLILIPFHSLFRLGAIFVEGLRYGKDNWKKGVHDKEYQEERLEHTIRHMILYKEGDKSEDHLAKVMWFCSTQMELERMELINPSDQLDKKIISGIGPIAQAIIDEARKA